LLASRNRAVSGISEPWLKGAVVETGTTPRRQTGAWP
jgi:hypothetical protein